VAVYGLSDRAMLPYRAPEGYVETMLDALSDELEPA
jgi:hypothetical protein